MNIIDNVNEEIREGLRNETKIDNILSKEMSTINNEEIKINLIVNNKTFTAMLENNQTVQELIQRFPLTVNMNDLHSNEKYTYLNSNLTTNSSVVNIIHAGDIKLFGDNCLVIFYKNFKNSYSYTNLGKIDNVDGFVDEIGKENVNIRFELSN